VCLTVPGMTAGKLHPPQDECGFFHQPTKRLEKWPELAPSVVYYNGGIIRPQQGSRLWGSSLPEAPEQRPTAQTQP
jgi:hypothetical protein